MPVFRAREGLLFQPESIESQLRAVFVDAEAVSGTASRAVFETETYTYTLRGDDLTYDGTGALTGGTLNGVTADLSSLTGYRLIFRQLGFDVADLVARAEAERSGTDPAALETFLYGLDWTLRANSSSHSFLDGATTADGVAISLTGDNDVRLKFGNDRFDAGAGDDTVRAGGGDDVVDGGAGNDELRGNRGVDVLYGGADDDLLNGGHGGDSLEGGTGNDTLNGASGRDTLNGGDGADLFVFRESRWQDVIDDFEPGIDRIEIVSNGAVTQTDTALGLRIDIGPFGGLFLTDVTTADLMSGDIVLIAI